MTDRYHLIHGTMEKELGQPVPNVVRADLVEVGVRPRVSAASTHISTKNIFRDGQK